MKIRNLVLLFIYIHVVGCSNKVKKEIVTNATIVENDSMNHQETEFDFNITSIEVLQPDLNNERIKMGTEKPVYPLTIDYLTIWVDNNTDIPLDIGRNWSIEIWNGMKWNPAKSKKYLFWTDDGRASKETHIRYYFKYPIGEYYILKEGKYRITKTFTQEKKLIKLYADFEIK